MNYEFPYQVMTTRFLMNMQRIAGWCKLIWSDVDVLKPTGLFRSEGLRADLLRAIVVFLHATFEDLLRSMALKKIGKLTFSSGKDIDKSLRNAGLDPAPFKSLYPPLIQMAKRRNRIVHEADLSKKSDTAPEVWGVTDDWQLLMWLTAVPAFHSLCRSVHHNDRVAQETYSKLIETKDGLVGFARQLLAFPETPSDMRIKALQSLVDSLDRLSTSLSQI
jgi:hypothetical protein